VFLIGQRDSTTVILTHHFVARTMNEKYDALVEIIIQNREL
jgi:hypothetical protein